MRNLPFFIRPNWELYLIISDVLDIALNRSGTYKFILINDKSKFNN